MKKGTFKSYEDLPLMLSVPEMAAALGISRAGAYELARSEGFPALRIVTRIVIPKDELREWIKRNMGKQETQYKTAAPDFPGAALNLLTN